MLDFLDYGLMFALSIGLYVAFGDKLPSEIKHTSEDEE